MKVHHIGYLVKNISKSIDAFSVIGFTISDNPVFDESRKAHICFMENDGYRIELIAPAKDSNLYPLLKRFGNAPYHMCYYCSDISETIKNLESQKFMLILEPAPAPAIEDRNVAFMINNGTGIIELLEE